MAHDRSTSSKVKHIAVIGGGPGGYTAAFRAADLGLNVTLIDRNETLGGVCLNRGCIPSKALLHAANLLTDATDASALGIEFGKPSIDLNKLRDWKNTVVKQLTDGLVNLSSRRKVNVVRGSATFVNSNTLCIERSDGSKIELSFDQIILATGSSPIKPRFAIESEHLLDSTSALDLKSIPKLMLVIGGGYIGLEIGTIYAGLGSQIDIVEALPQLLTGTDRDLVSLLEQQLKRTFHRVDLETKVVQCKETPNGINVTVEDNNGNKASREYEKVLVAIGRAPNTDSLNLENTKVTVDDNGFVEVDENQLTLDPSIFAIGDVTGQPMLAHKASHEGTVAAENAANRSDEPVAFEPKAIPAVVFTDPEIATCGLSETRAKELGMNVSIQKFPWAASGKAMTICRTNGVTKIIFDPETEKVLGVAIAGKGASEMIAEGVLALEMEATAGDLMSCIHPHPTVSETIMESAESFFGLCTHLFKPKRK